MHGSNNRLDGDRTAPPPQTCCAKKFSLAIFFVRVSFGVFFLAVFLFLGFAFFLFFLFIRCHNGKTRKLSGSGNGKKHKHGLGTFFLVTGNFLALVFEVLNFVGDERVQRDNGSHQGGQVDNQHVIVGLHGKGFDQLLDGQVKQ